MIDGPMNDMLAQQYERWPYPTPLRCLDHPILEEARILRHRYWPRGGPDCPLDVLVAGCGTREAALVAYYNRDARIVGIDVSETSLRHERQLKRDYGLANLELRHLPIERAPELGETFDLVHCHGVLHHLDDPVAGIRALREALRPGGSIRLMVYGAYGRAGIRMLSSLFRMLGADQDSHGLDLVRSTVATLGPHHPAHRFLSAYGLVHDAAFVDTFLNRRDIDYTVDGLMELITAAGLRFQRWANNEWYYPDAHVPSGIPLYRTIAALPDATQWRAMELFHAITQHYVVVCRDDRAPESCGVDADGPDLSSCVPIIDRERLRSRGLRFLDTLNPLDSALFRFMDGRRTLGECIDATGFQMDASTMLEAARSLVKRLSRMGLLDLTRPGVLP